MEKYTQKFIKNLVKQGDKKHTDMKRYLVLERQKYLNGTYSTRVVAEFDNLIQANDEMLRLRDDSSEFYYYRVICLFFPKF